MYCIASHLIKENNASTGVLNDKQAQSHQISTYTILCVVNAYHPRSDHPLTVFLSYVRTLKT